VGGLACLIVYTYQAALLLLVAFATRPFFGDKAMEALKDIALGIAAGWFIYDVVPLLKHYVAVWRTRQRQVQALNDTVKRKLFL